MSWLYVPGRAGEYLPRSTFSSGEPSATLKSETTPPPSSPQGSGTGTRRKRRSGAMYEALQSVTGKSVASYGNSAAYSTASWLRQVSRANRSALPAPSWQATTVAIFGPTSFASYVKSGPHGSYWKTSQACFPSLTGTLDRYSENWPKAGMMRNGSCSRLRTVVRHIEETDYGLLPTPTKLDHRSPSRNGGAEEIYTDSTGKPRRRMPTGGTATMGLSRMAEMGMWPTPVVPNGGRTLHHIEDWRSPRTAYHKGKKVQVSLEHAVKNWPTPNKRDWKGPPGKGCHERGGHQASLPLAVEESAVSGKLNPTWTEWLMGWIEEWTDLRPLEKDKFRLWLQLHGVS